MENELKQLVEELYPSMINWRRDFHKYAESGWVEFRTASIVAAKLSEWGYEVKAGREVMKAEARMGVPSSVFLQEQEQRALQQGADPNWLPHFSGGFTGIVAILDTGKPGPTLGMRVDLDALDIQESMDHDHFPVAQDFVSVNSGMMHSCGHDAHTTIGLGVAYILMKLKDRLKGKIKIIFQPSEEGVRGETTEINEYVLEQALQIIKGSAIMYDVKEHVEIVGQADSSESSAELLPYIRSQAERVAEVRAIYDTCVSGGSEDATYLMERVKQHGGLASYLIFGTTLAAGHHNEKFDIDENVLKIAVKTLSLCILNADELPRRTQ